MPSPVEVSCPTHENMALCTRVPHGSKYFRYYNLSDAFHSCKLMPATSDLVVAQFNGKYYQYLVGAQGIANIIGSSLEYSPYGLF